MLGGLRTLKMTHLQRALADESRTVFSGVRAGSSAVEVKVFFTSLCGSDPHGGRLFSVLELFPERLERNARHRPHNQSGAVR